MRTPPKFCPRQEALFADLEVPDYAEAQPQDAPVATARPPRRSPGWGLWLAFILAAIAAISVAVWLFAPRGPVIVTIPSVAGQTVDQAGQALRAEGLVVSETLDQRYDDDIPAGLVVGTDPEAGAEVEQESTVTLVISQGVEPTALPPMIGLSLEEAETRLTEARLVLGQTSEEFSATTPSGSILEVSNESGVAIAPGTELEADTVINLVVSAGALPTVEGLTVEEAEAALEASGLTGVVGGDGEFSETIPEGRVIRYETPAGATITPGDTLTLTISRGPPLVTVPDVIGETIADAVAELEALEFEVEVRSNFTEDVWDDENVRVTSLEPADGQQVPVGSTVIIRSFF